MNKMLPSVQRAHEEAALLSEKKLKEGTDPDEPAKKKIKIEGIKKLLE